MFPKTSKLRYICMTQYLLSQDQGRTLVKYYMQSSPIIRQFFLLSFSARLQSTRALIDAGDLYIERASVCTHVTYAFMRRNNKNGHELKALYGTLKQANLSCDDIRDAKYITNMLFDYINVHNYCIYLFILHTF